MSGSKSRFKYPFPVGDGSSRQRMEALIDECWFLNRTPVNPDTTKCVQALSKAVPGQVLKVKSGARCLTWRIPKNWAVRSARLLTMSGEVLVDYVDSPLYLWMHSTAFSGVVGRQELLDRHVLTDPNRPAEFLYHYRNSFKYDAAEWGFSLPYSLVETMTDDEYRVEIDTDLDDSGDMQVFDAFLPGEMEDTVFVMAHTCHPAQVSDGIANIAVALELYRVLAEQPSRRYSYRFIFGPEYYAAAAYLSESPSDVVKSLRYGLYLDMLSNHEPLGWQSSMQGNSYIDKVLANIIPTHVGTFLEKEYRGLWGNDEMFYNAYPYLIPTVGLGRGPHREYHYNTDNFDNLDSYHLEESLWVLQRMVEVFEGDVVPDVGFEGPLCLSEHGLYIDPSESRPEARVLERIFAMADGQRSCLDIAASVGADFFEVRDLFLQLEMKELCRLTPRPLKEGDSGTLDR